MTLELKQYFNLLNRAYERPYLLGGVRGITNDTDLGPAYFSITTAFDCRTFFTRAFEYVRDRDTGEYYIRDGEWVREEGGEGGGQHNPYHNKTALPSKYSTGKRKLQGGKSKRQ